MENGDRLASISDRLKPFLANNPNSRVVEIESPKKAIVIARPWGDSSLSIVIPPNFDALIEQLNNVSLPERFTAIWHKDNKLFEIIYTAYPFSSTEDVVTRAFTFKHRGKTFECWFGSASERLLSIAENFLPVGAPMVSFFRNLPSFQNYVFAEKNIDGFSKVPNSQPICFWIRGIDWNDDAVLDLVRHLNFYMAYFDAQSPQIIIQSPTPEDVTEQAQSRFPTGSFPKSINSNPIDDALLHFWAASIVGDPVRRFLYNYQILEYGAFFFVEDQVKRTIRKYLTAPDAAENVEVVTQQMIGALGESKIAEVQKFENLLRACVDPKVIWRELERNLRHFAAPFVFEGGFTLQPFVKENWTVDDFSVAWLPAFSNALRLIRNALSHGREVKMATVITPTTANFRILQRWIGPIAAAAREVMVYRQLA